MNIEAEIGRIVDAAQNPQSVRDAIAAATGTVPDWAGVIRYQNLMIGVSRTGDSDEADRSSRWLRELEISAAPDWLGFPIGSGEYQVGVLRYWTCPGERLIPVREWRAPFSEASRRRFRQDMERLFDHGKMFAYIRGDAHWLVSEKTGAIVLWGWQLIDTAEKKREEYFESIDRTLARNT